MSGQLGLETGLTASLCLQVRVRRAPSGCYMARNRIFHSGIVRSQGCKGRRVVGLFWACLFQIGTAITYSIYIFSSAPHSGFKVPASRLADKQW